MDNFWSPCMEDVQVRLKELYAFINAHRAICNAHSVDYYLKNHWDTHIPESWKAEILYTRTEDHFINPQPRDSHLDQGSFMEFVCRAKQLRLPLISGPGDVCEHSASSGLVSFGMTAKKSHEVEKFSECVHEFAIKGQPGVKQVIDVGSGKGYLGEYLALTYGVPVIGFDSQASNTAGAFKRNKKVRNEWKNVTRGTKDKPLRKVDEVEIDSSANDITFEEEELYLPNLFIDEDIEHEPNPFCIRDNSQHFALLRKPEITHFCPTKKMASSKPFALSSYYPVTMEISTDNYDELLKQAEKSSLSQFNSKERFCIVGLHACGDLTSTALKMFTSIPSATAVVVVGCCYHHITEECSTAGFPLSSFMMSSGGHLGRTARMLACQALSRFSEITSMKALLRIHWRSMLQVLLSRKYPELFLLNCGCDLTVGRMKRVPSDFKEYCSIALQRLKVDLSKVNDADISNVQLEHESMLCELQGFIRVRAVLASCIESCIILDRLLYIQEQEHTQNAGIVQLFNPVVSPRCYAIVALKCFNTRVSPMTIPSTIPNKS